MALCIFVRGSHMSPSGFVFIQKQKNSKAAARFFSVVVLGGGDGGGELSI
jgi:hypothetical protein